MRHNVSLNLETVYQLKLCDIPKHLDRHEYLYEDFKSVTHDCSFDSFMPQLMKKTRIFCFSCILIYQKNTASLILFHCKYLTSNHSFLFPSWNLILGGGCVDL